MIPTCHAGIWQLTSAAAQREAFGPCTFVVLHLVVVTRSLGSAGPWSRLPSCWMSMSSPKPRMRKLNRLRCGQFGLGFISVLFLAIWVTLPLCAASARRRAVGRSAARLDRERLESVARKVALATRIDAFHRRLHWENAPFLDGELLLAVELNKRTSGSGDALIDNAANVLLMSDDPIDSVSWADGTAFSQAALDLYRVLPPTDDRRQPSRALVDGPLKFAAHAIGGTPDTVPPRDPWWVPGGYGTRFWQDDMYMVIPWLAMAGSTRDGLPGSEEARNLAYEWVEAYVYDHRRGGGAVPSERSRQGYLLWDPAHALFQHAPDNIGDDDFWARGNAWSALALLRATEYLDRSYTAARYDRVVSTAEMRDVLIAIAARLVEMRGPDGGWPSSLSSPSLCGPAETSATGFFTYFLASGINQRWLDRDSYLPVVRKALAILADRVDSAGVVSGIQPPGMGPDCSGVRISTNGSVNVNYGAGAVLLAISEVLKMTDDDLVGSVVTSARRDSAAGAESF